jgi:hypothetical protein
VKRYIARVFTWIPVSYANPNALAPIGGDFQSIGPNLNQVQPLQKSERGGVESLKVSVNEPTKGYDSGVRLNYKTFVLQVVW